MKRVFSFLTIKINRHSTAYVKIGTIFFIVSLLGSCRAMFVDKQELVAFRVLNRINYPYQEVLNKEESVSLQDLLTDEEISTLEQLSNSAPFLENFMKTKCAGCTYTFGRFKPMYRVKKGKFIHFGLQNEMGLENWVFKKSGAFVTRFDMFQGESKEQIHEELKDIQSVDYVLEGVYPLKIKEKQIYLEHIAFQYQSEIDDQWYRPMFPTKINYEINLTEKSPVLRFKIDGGLFSYQSPNDQGEFQIINFVEPLIYANAVSHDEPMSYSSFTHGFYANATFFILNLEEDTQVSIRIDPKAVDMDFKFSVFENEGFYTMEEYLQKESPLFERYQNTMGHGKYLIRVLHEDSDYTENPLFTVYIDKSNVD